MQKRVYIETTIASYYFEIRPEPEMVARRNWTREWWESERERYELVTSVAVLEELERGDYPVRSNALDLLRDVPLVANVPEIIPIVNVYVARHVMPADPRGDALHLALASYHRCHFLLTWNCRHLANANKFEHIRHVNAELGLFSPILATPVELLQDEVSDLNSSHFYPLRSPIARSTCKASPKSPVKSTPLRVFPFSVPPYDFA